VSRTPRWRPALANALPSAPAAALPAVLAAVLAAALAGCDGPAEPPPVVPPPVVVTIEPASATVLVRAGLAFTAAVTGTTSGAVTYSVVEGPAGGTVSETGAYQAPSAPGTYRVRATSVAEITRHADAVVTVRDYGTGFERVGDPSRGYDHHTATLLADGTALVVGGFGMGAVHAGTDRYLPEAKEFEPGPDLATPRMEHAATLLADGRLLVTGGWNLLDGGSPFDPSLRSTEILDPDAGGFAAGPDMERPRRNHVMTSLADGRVLVTGGIQLRGTGFGATPHVEVFDPVTGAFAAVGAMGTGRWRHTATRLADGRVLVVGGRDNNCTIGCEWHALRTAELFDPATGAFEPTGSLTWSRFAHGAALLPDGRVAIFGGTTTEDLGDTDQVTAVEVYDPATGTFSVAGATFMGRSFGALAPLANGRFLLAGGYNQNGHPTGTSEIWDPTTGTSAPGPEMSDWRFRAVAVVLLSGEVLVVGGNNSGAPVVPVDLYR
jgi:hypothetical protein